MKLRAFDCHTHQLTGDRAKQSESRISDGSRLFGGGGHGGPGFGGDQVEFYRQRNLMGIVFDVDSETTTGLRISNDEVLELSQRSGGLLIPFGSVDPWKGAAAVREIERCKGLGFRGMKFQPITQAFFPDDPRFFPMWETCQLLELPVLIHMGTTAIGNDSPGGRGLSLKYGRPIPHLDDLAARFPHLSIIAAHPGWPFHTELLAVARHKGNVHIDLSGWAPKHLPEEVLRYANSVMPNKFLFGSDYPLMSPDRWLNEFESLSIKPESRKKILYENACRLFDLQVSDFSDEAAASAEEGPA